MADFKPRSQVFHYKQASFGAGELSPDLYARDDLDRYAVGAKKLLNFFPHPFGGVSNRPGTEFIAAVKEPNKYTRLYPFQFSQEQAYVLEFGDKYIRIIKDGGLVLNGSTIVEITTPYASSDLAGLHFTQSADTLYILHRKYSPMTLTRSSHTVWSLTNFKFERGPFRNQNVTDVKLTPSGLTGNITVTASGDVFDQKMVGGLIRISHEVFDQFVSVDTAGDITTASIKCNGKWTLQMTAAEKATIRIQISTDNGATWGTLREYDSLDTSAGINDSGTIDYYALLRINITNTSGSKAGAMTLGADAFINDGVIEITEYIDARTIKGNVYVDSNEYVFGLPLTTATTLWAIGAWNDLYGYPGCAVFFQDRLVLASSTRDPLTIWFSQTGNYTGFYAHGKKVQDDDAITAPLVSSAVNSIENMVALGYILAFTAGGEWKIGASSASAALTPTSISAVQQGYVGASDLAPVVIADRALFVSVLGNIVRDFAYDIYSESFKGDDMTLYAKHLFRNHSLKDWAYQMAPDNIVWAVRDDGKLLSFTYIKEQQVWAWAEHETDGEVESIACIPGKEQNEVYMVAKRRVNGGYTRYLEHLQPRLATIDPRRQMFLDCGLSLDSYVNISGIDLTNPILIHSVAHGLSGGDIIDILNVKGTTELNGRRYRIGVTTSDTFTIVDYDTGLPVSGIDFTPYDSGGEIHKCYRVVSGLEHLEGKTVRVVADGSNIGDFSVESGAIDMGMLASIVHVGLPYTSKMQTLDLALPRNDGTSMGRPKRISGIIARFKDTFEGYIGINGFDDMTPIEPTLGDIWGEPGSLASGDIEVDPYSEYSNEASITVMQDQPFPMTLLSLVGKVEME